VSPFVLPLEPAQESKRVTGALDRWLDVHGRPLGIVVSGAPVEHLPFEEVRYWKSLVDVFDRAREEQIPVLGICFGGLAIAGYLGLEKRVLPEKAFGLVETRSSPRGQRFFGENARYALPMSTWALIASGEVERRADAVEVLLASASAEPLMLGSREGDMIAMLGHPEYSADDLRREWLRDRPKGIPYTRDFDDSSFDRASEELALRGCPALKRWLSIQLLAVEATL